MNIDSYISDIEAALASYSIISSYSLSVDRKTGDIAFISGSVEFRNNAILDFKEFVEIKEGSAERYMYGYNYRLNDKLVFRYDNSPDPQARKFETYPHHKHISDGGLAASGIKTLREVLEEIDEMFGQASD